MSLKQVAGGPSPAAIAETRTNAKAASGVSGKYAVIDGSDQASNEFPYVPFAPDSYDDIADIKQNFAVAQNVGENWIVPFTDQDANYVRRQRDQMENADFDRWIMQKFDLQDPAQLFLFQQIAPEQFQRRMDLIDYEQNIVTRYAKLRLMGARTLDDLKFEWLIETGRIELPQGPIWDPVQWMNNQLHGGPHALPANIAEHGDNANRNRSRFMAGLFSPIKMLSETQVGWQPTTNMADIRGNPLVRTTNQLFEGSNRPDSYIHYGGNPIVNEQPAIYNADVYGAKFGNAVAGGAVARLAGARNGYGRRPAVGGAPAAAPLPAPGDPGYAGALAAARAGGFAPRPVGRR